MLEYSALIDLIIVGTFSAPFGGGPMLPNQAPSFFFFSSSVGGYLHSIVSH
jgi:hypothetical protein